LGFAGEKADKTARNPLSEAGCLREEDGLVRVSSDDCLIWEFGLRILEFDLRFDSQRFRCKRGWVSWPLRGNAFGESRLASLKNHFVRGLLRLEATAMNKFSLQQSLSFLLLPLPSVKRASAGGDPQTAQRQ
jgi:hypothetical protein